MSGTYEGIYPPFGVSTPFVGDSGSGGVQGLVPAPSAGDASANKFLAAGGGWAIPSGTGGGATTIGAIDSQTPSSNGGTISGSNFYFQSASTSNAGLMNTSSQSFTGVKTFASIVSSGNIQTATFRVTTLPISGYVLTSDSVGVATWQAPAASGIGSVGTIDTQTPSSDGAVISGSSIYMQSASTSNAGLMNTSSQSFTGVKTFASIVSSGNIQTATFRVTTLPVSGYVLTSDSVGVATWQSLPSSSITLTNDVTGSGSGSISTTIANNVVNYAKFQQVNSSKLIGNPTSSLANASEITLGATLSFSGSSLHTNGFSGDVTSSSNSFNTTVTNVGGSSASSVNSTVITVAAATNNPTANTIVMWDSDSNLSANNIQFSLSSISSSSTTLTMNSLSPRTINVTGISTQLIKLPSGLTVFSGIFYTFINLSTGLLTIENSAGTTVTTVTTGLSVTVVLLVGFSNIWYAISSASSGGVTSVTGTTNQILVTPTTGATVVSIATGYVGQTSLTTLGVVTTATWNADPIDLSSYATGVLQAAQFPTLSGDVTNTGLSLTVASVGGSAAIDINNTVLQVAAASTIPMPSNLILWDANSNLSSNAFFSELLVLVSSGADLNMSAATQQNILVTGSTPQTILLPQGSSLPFVGASYTIMSTSSGLVTVGNFTPTTITTIGPNQIVTFYLTDVSSDGVWFYTSTGSVSGITALTGDVTASGSGSVVATVAFVGGSSAANVHSTVVSVAAATSTATASTLMLWDSNKNVNANNYFAGLQNIISSASTFNMLSNTPQSIVISGLLNQTITLPQGSTLPLGASYTICNNSSMVIQMQDYAATPLTTIQSGDSLFFLLISTSGGGGVGAWYWNNITGSTGVTSVTAGAGISATPSVGAVVVSIATGYVGQTSLTTLGTITTGVWNGTAINLASYASGILQDAQFPALTGDVTTTAGSLATTIRSSYPGSITALGILTSLTVSGQINNTGPAQENLDVAVSPGSSYALNPANGTSFGITLTANITFTIASAPATTLEQIIDIDLIQDGTGGRTVTWPVAITWLVGQPPTINLSAGAITSVSLRGTVRGWTGVYAIQPVPIVSSALAPGSAVSLTTTVIADVVNVIVPANQNGFICGTICFKGSSITATQFQSWIGTASGNVTTGQNLSLNTVSSPDAPTSATDLSMALPSFPITSSGSTQTFYLKALGIFSAGSPSAYGSLVFMPTIGVVT